MDRQQLEIVRDALDALGLALADHNHQWTPEERKAYEDAEHILNVALYLLEDEEKDIKGIVKFTSFDSED